MNPILSHRVVDLFLLSRARKGSGTDTAEAILQNVLLSWSSGKDSAWALHLLRKQPDLSVTALVTTFNESAGRVAMHAVRRSLVHAQADRLGLQLWEVPLPWPCTNDVYEGLMADVYARAVHDGIAVVAFGDLFLEDIRAYRVAQTQSTGLEPLFPVWGIPTDRLAREMIDGGIRAKLTCVDPTKLDASFVGREFDLDLLADLPASVDPCGENGEFHTFVYDAPVFSSPIEVRQGEVVVRDGFVFSDLISSAEE
jgi:uncharacterized protein (TIGR00290 family)